MFGKWISPLLLVPILLSGCAGGEQPVKDEQDSTEVDSEAPATETNLDVIANDEKIIEMLKKTGVISEDASQEEIEKALQKYLQDKNSHQLTNEKEKKKYIDEIKKKIQEGTPVEEE
ncbi:hypothetical protein FGG79_17645 [Bacillus sp. BHET2]|uniref:hypothetical protein n=1 Tax=Bacillus sp. BHET2 TaxID=2583818 RepID=UPI00110D8A90|nr:hypothetical protein [Bacillus sp. BHET2]TMU83969.1 hypothetical protein FGG79_17645 [Bacillus sp. BHET2]